METGRRPKRICFDDFLFPVIENKRIQTKGGEIEVIYKRRVARVKRQDKEAKEEKVSTVAKGSA